MNGRMGKPRYVRHVSRFYRSSNIMLESAGDDLYIKLFTMLCIMFYAIHVVIYCIHDGRDRHDRLLNSV